LKPQLRSSAANDRTQVWDLPLEKIGGTFETLDIFPAKTNTEFVEVVNRGYVKMRVWERGAGITLACGTGACATVVAGVLEGRCVPASRGCLARMHLRLPGSACVAF